MSEQKKKDKVESQPSKEESSLADFCQNKKYQPVQEVPSELLKTCQSLQIARQAPRDSWQIKGLLQGKENLPFYLFEYKEPGQNNKPPLQYRVLSFLFPLALPSLTLWEQGKGALPFGASPGVRKIYFQSDRFNNAFFVYGEKIFAYELLSPGMMEFLIGYSKESVLPVSIEILSDLIFFYYRPSGQSHIPAQLDQLIGLGKEFCRNIPPIIEEKYGAN